MTEPAAYFVRRSDRTFQPTPHTRGAWSQTEQHISPLNGLAVHALEQALDPGDGKVVGRLSFDILGPVSLDELTVDVEVLRPGRTVELVEAVVVSRGRRVLRCSAWRLARVDTAEVAGGGAMPLPAPADVPVWDMTSVWPGAYIASLDTRRTADSRPGRATAWVSSRLALVEDEPVSALATFVSLVDTANGVAVRHPPEQWLFPNVDLTIHLHRQPVAGPVGLDTTVVFGPDGQGLTSSVLSDVDGPVGTAAQVLTLRPRVSPSPSSAR
ncbi:MAG: thioesterase [Frankiales bacterium]|nr:thioesterase [Frankiales bacterium]